MRRFRVEEPGLTGETAVSPGDHQAALRKRFQIRRGGGAFHLRMVGPGMPVPGIQKAVDEILLIGQEEQPFGILIESTRRIDPRREPALRQGALPGQLGGELAEHSVGLVQGDEHV